jgi:NTE family protein
MNSNFAGQTSSPSGLSSSSHKKFGLSLSGGGARGAYQAGVLQAIVEISTAIGIKQPFPVLTGVSAGSINAAFLAGTSDNLEQGCAQLSALWSGLTADRIFKTDALSAGRSGFRFLADATIGAMYAKKLARSLLDTAPLHELLRLHVPFDRIARNLKNDCFDALAITAMNYANSTSITWVEGKEGLPMWDRSRRQSLRSPISVDHIMGSAAIPLFFPPVKVDTDHYGDGCLRNTAPLSPAIHLGANHLFVISVRRPDDKAVPVVNMEPSLARVLGVILNALLLDAIEIDMERMSRINHTIELVPEKQRKELNLQKVDYLWIRPSEDIGNLAGELYHRLPRVIRYLIGGLGSSKEASELTSYLLFDPDFCGQLVQIGYRDGINQRVQIEKFLSA